MIRSSFTLGLLEIFAYILPGSLALSAALYRLKPALLERAFAGIGEQALFLAAGYAAGHILTLASISVLKVRGFFRKRLRRRLAHQRSREERLSFYEDLRAELRSTFGENLQRSDEYFFSLRVVADNLPGSLQTIDRLYAITLFSRNMAAGTVFSTLCAGGSQPLVWFAGVLLVALFFIRYIQVEQTLANTVFRSAYVYFRLQRMPEDK